ncbi:MAG: hypothetical protein AAFN74_09940 [Myxococcota bacterium]
MKAFTSTLALVCAGAFVTACGTTQTTTAKNKPQIKRCEKVKRTGSRFAKLECHGEPPLGLGVMNGSEANRQLNATVRPTGNR